MHVFMHLFTPLFIWACICTLLQSFIKCKFCGNSLAVQWLILHFHCSWCGFDPLVWELPMWELDHKKGWVLKSWCLQIVVLEKILESLLDSKEIKPVNTKGNQPWIFIGRTDAEAEAPILWPPDVKSQFIGKELDAGKDWRQNEKRAAEVR